MPLFRMMEQTFKVARFVEEIEKKPCHIWEKPLQKFSKIAVASATQNMQPFRLLISNQEIKDLTKIVKSLEESGLLINSVSKTIENEAKELKV